MIFVTVGSMLPFNRLIQAMDEWAGAPGAPEVFAQIGESDYRPARMPFERMLPPDRFKKVLHQATLIVAHAGMGSVISAMEVGKPIVILPRRVEYHEVTTNHQVDTAEWLKGKPGIFVADREASLKGIITTALTWQIADNERIASTASNEFVERIRRYISR